VGTSGLSSLLEGKALLKRRRIELSTEVYITLCVAQGMPGRVHCSQQRGEIKVTYVDSDAFVTSRSAQCNPHSGEPLRTSINIM
jgi:hypothetical protein